MKKKCEYEYVFVVGTNKRCTVNGVKTLELLTGMIVQFACDKTRGIKMMTLTKSEADKMGLFPEFTILKNGKAIRNIHPKKVVKR